MGEKADAWAAEGRKNIFGQVVDADSIVNPILRLKGDTIPVSAMPINGAIATGTKRLEYKGVPGNPATRIDKLPFLSEPNNAEPYVAYPPSCSGCEEVPYIHLVTQLYGNRMIIAGGVGQCVCLGHAPRFAGLTYVSI